MKKYSVAVIMTCYNRREKTEECLYRLKMQVGIDAVNVRVYLVDDGSSDGTEKMLKDKYPDVYIIKGDGGLFWCGGMRLAFGLAIKDKHEFYLWLNDDTMLFEKSLKKMLDSYYELRNIKNNDVIVVGSLCESHTQELTYGGSRIPSGLHRTRYQMIKPCRIPQRCDLFHGNCVLIPHGVAKNTGNMSHLYKHGPGDKDYALRAKKCGYESWICPGYVGTCSRNELLKKWKQKNLTMNERVQALNHPALKARVEDWIVYTKIYHRVLWPIFFVNAQIRLYLPRIYILLKTCPMFSKSSSM